MATTLALVAEVALAGPVVIDDVELNGGQGTIFDAQNSLDPGVTGPCIAGVGFTPAEDGTWGNGSKNDAFDGGLYIVVGGQTFNDPDGMGSQPDETLRVGPQQLRGLKVTRIETALPGNPALRSLIKLRNPSPRARGRTIIWDSALGADEDEDTRASSSGDMRFTEADRWIVTSDDAVSPGDPAVTFVLYGQRARVTIRKVIWAPEDIVPGDVRGEACVSVKFRVRVPAKSTRYLLFFTEFHDTNENAIADAPKYNRRTLRPKLTEGLGPAVKQRIVNWDLT